MVEARKSEHTQFPLILAIVAAVIAIATILGQGSMISRLQVQNETLQNELADQATLFREMTTPDRPAATAMDADAQEPANAPR